MSLFSIADLHLSEAVNKPMDVFGSRWTDYRNKLTNRWRSIVTDDDTVIVPGDISWGLSLDEAIPDLKLLDSLPGKKIIGKGNHDLWWGTASKVYKAFEENGITTIKLLHNNAFEVEDYIISGTRGWYVEEKYQNTQSETDYAKIVAREAGRLTASLNEALKLRGDSDRQILVYFHFPPVFNGFVCRELVDVLKNYGIKQIYFGHIHATYFIPKTTEFEGISMTLISADYLDFIPMITAPSIEY